MVGQVIFGDTRSPGLAIIPFQGGHDLVGAPALIPQRAIDHFELDTQAGFLDLLLQQFGNRRGFGRFRIEGDAEDEGLPIRPQAEAIAAALVKPQRVQQAVGLLQIRPRGIHEGLAELAEEDGLVNLIRIHRGGDRLPEAAFGIRDQLLPGAAFHVILIVEVEEEHGRIVEGTGGEDLAIELSCSLHQNRHVAERDVVAARERDLAGHDGVECGRAVDGEVVDHAVYIG